MNLNGLFKKQQKLDKHIEKEKGLEGQDLLDEKILALQVELGELANEWRGFKFWKDNPEPRTEYICELCEGSEEIGRDVAFGDYEMGFEVFHSIGVVCPLCEDIDDAYNPLLEEYVDCLHFILSIGNHLEFMDLENIAPHTRDTITEAFKEMFNNISDFSNELNYGNSYDLEDAYEFLLGDFYGLGEMLGFLTKDIEQAYYKKNKINHERQANNY